MLSAPRHYSKGCSWGAQSGAGRPELGSGVGSRGSQLGERAAETMGSQPPARPLFLRPGRVRPARPTLPDQIFPAKLPHKHKHRMCLAGLPAFSSRA